MSLITDTLDRSADTDQTLLPALSERWSPRGFDVDAVIDERVLTTVLEAARWAPSASNSQPSRFIVARRGSDAFAAIETGLMGFNRAWASAASVLIVNIAELETDGRENRWARYDLGQAVAHLSVQAQHEGLHSHQMGGIDTDVLASAFAVAKNHAIVSVTALGVLADVATLDAALLERESAPRTRKPLAELLLSND
jgi:nitroreductase